MINNNLLGDHGFQVFAQSVNPTELLSSKQSYQDILPVVLQTVPLKLEYPKFVIRKDTNPHLFTRDVFPLEVWMPFVSCILPLVPMEIEFIAKSAPLPSSRSSWIEHTPLRIAYAAAPPKTVVSLNVGDILVFWSTMIYRPKTPNSSYLHLPAGVESSRKDLLLKLTHVPTRVEPFPWTLTLPQTLVGFLPWTSLWASQFVFQHGASEVQRAEFVRKYRHAVFAPEWNALRLATNPSNTPNRTTFFTDPPSGVVLTADAAVAFHRVFVFQPYGFWVVSVCYWVLLILLLIVYFVQRYRNARNSRTVPPPHVWVLPPAPPPVRRRKRRRTVPPPPPPPVSPPKPRSQPRQPSRQIVVKIATR